MFFGKNRNGNEIQRSALQKAVRKGDVELVERCCKYLTDQDDFTWLKSRLYVMVFEECWGYGYKLNISNDPDLIIQEYKTIAGLVKNRDASALGVLGYELSIGNSSVLQHDSGDSAIRKIAEGIENPEKFWKWIKRRTKTNKQILMIYKAQMGNKKAGWPWDKAMPLAAAYLAVTGKIPQVKSCKIIQTEMPLWVGIDKHTDKGRKAIRTVAKSEGVSSRIALWCSFYFESVISNESQNCYWWNREKEWRFNSLGSSYQEAEEIWKKLKAGVQKLLEAESNNLKNVLGIK